MLVVGLTTRNPEELLRTASPTFLIKDYEDPKLWAALEGKVRKPYTITKQRERWTEEEHKKFLEALKLYSRTWRRIEVIRRKPKLILTRPKEPKLETSQRVRSVKIKSSTELEEEMMAKIPKFKARPINKKILEPPTLPTLPRSTPQLPEFQEFHLETMVLLPCCRTSG